MAYKKRGFTKNRGFKPRATSFEDIEVRDASKPTNEGQINTTLSTKSLSKLPRSPITPKLDPYTQVLPGSYPYALLNALNRPIGASYSGDDNLDGGNTQQFTTSEQSGFLNCFDVFSAAGRINYRYLPIASTDLSRGGQYVQEMLKAITENQSLVNATTFTQLAANQYVVNTSIPIPSAQGVLASDDGADLSGADAPGFYAWAIYYQIILNSLAGAMTCFNRFRANMGEMMRMSWNRETPRLNSYFGLMQKKSFLAQWDSLGYSIEGEYFDLDWMQQFGTLTALTSRRAEACTEPLLELALTHEIPTSFTLKYAGKTVYDHNDLDTACTNASTSMPDGYTFSTFSEMLVVLSTLLSVEDTLWWVRNPDSISEQARFDAISNIVQVLNQIANYFKPRMADLRIVFDTMGRVNVNQWRKTARLKVVRDTDIPVQRNLLVDSFYKMIGGGSNAMTWNDTTYRWTGYTLWNMYTGVPEYDSKSGGAFLSFSTKVLPDKLPTGASAYLPIAIGALYRIRTTNRRGVRINLSQSVFDPSINVSTARLKPLPSMSVTMRCLGPTSASGLLLSSENSSYLMAACLKVFGIYRAEAGDNVTITSASDLAVEPDDLCFVAFEIEDLSNEMIAYARTKGPFVANQDDTSNMGFLGIGTH